MKDENVNKIINIGKKEECTQEEYDNLLELTSDINSSPSLYYLLQNLVETLLGRKVGHYKFNLRLCLEENDLTLDDLVNFIKGYHLVEKRYGDFGFGSPSVSKNLIDNLIEIDEEKSIELHNWIFFHGGNYHIESEMK